MNSMALMNRNELLITDTGEDRIERSGAPDTAFN